MFKKHQHLPTQVLYSAYEEKCTGTISEHSPLSIFNPANLKGQNVNNKKLKSFVYLKIKWTPHPAQLYSVQ